MNFSTAGTRHENRYPPKDHAMTSHLQPGDLDRTRWALHEACDISQAGITRTSGLPRERARAALRELERRGEASHSVGHHHGDGYFCQCNAGEAAKLPKIIHWYGRD